MKYKIRYHKAVSDDIYESWNWYEDRSEGLGDKFFDQVEAAIDKIFENPGSYQKITGNVRRFVVNKFPFIVVYVIKEDVITIVAVSHTSRMPGEWEERI